MSLISKPLSLSVFDASDGSVISTSGTTKQFCSLKLDILVEQFSSAFCTFINKPMTSITDVVDTQSVRRETRCSLLLSCIPLSLARNVTCWTNSCSQATKASSSIFSDVKVQRHNPSSASAISDMMSVCFSETLSVYEESKCMYKYKFHKEKQ